MEKPIKSDDFSVCICLDMCQEEISVEKREHEEVEQGDTSITNLQHQLNNFEADYEKVFYVICRASQT